MNLFGMGTQEIVIILIAALVIFGPNRLPEIAGKLGKAVGDLKRMSSDLTGELEKNKDIQDLKRTVQGEVSNFKSQVSGVADSAKKDLKSASGTANSAVASATGSTAAKPTTTSTISSVKASNSTSTTTKSTTSSSTEAAKPTVASKKDPLADFASFDEIKAPATVAPAATVAAAPSVAVAATTNGVPSDGDALSRARQRRLNAGYNRQTT